VIFNHRNPYENAMSFIGEIQLLKVTHNLFRSVHMASTNTKFSQHPDRQQVTISTVLRYTFVAALLWAAPEVANAAPREIRLPVVGSSVHIAGEPVFEISALNASRWVTAFNTAMSDGCQIELTDSTVIIRYDTDRLPKDSEQARASVRLFTREAAPQAFAAQLRTFGLMLPKNVLPTHPTVLLVHGLDSDRSKWARLAELLAGEGLQVGWFSYPSDQPITDSAALLAKHHLVMKKMFPDMPLSIVAHSMGSLVSRAYIEGDHYTGGIDRLILIAPPNHGSHWAKYRLLLEAQEHYGLWRHEPDWSPSWMITDGLGEAGGDMKPRSAFLTTLNDRPRRDGVKYTIIAGDQHPASRITGRTVSKVAGVLPEEARSLWGFRQSTNALQSFGDRIANQTSPGDGPVTLDSAQLPGVDDFIVLHGDHHSLYQPKSDNNPIAWESIRDRMKR